MPIGERENGRGQKNAPPLFLLAFFSCFSSFVIEVCDTNEEPVWSIPLSYCFSKSDVVGAWSGVMNDGGDIC